jgi:hypothetical protein
MQRTYSIHTKTELPAYVQCGFPLMPGAEPLTDRMSQG